MSFYVFEEAIPWILPFGYYLSLSLSTIIEGLHCSLQVVLLPALPPSGCVAVQGCCTTEGGNAVQVASPFGLLTIFSALPSTPKGSMVQQAPLPPKGVQGVRMQYVQQALHSSLPIPLTPMTFTQPCTAYHRRW